jgi:hypothetical protein
MMIAHEGQIILQSPGVALKLDKTERRIVLFRGKFYLIMLEYPAIRDESRMMKITWQGRYNRECSMMVGKPTGEFGPPQVERAIASLDQFNGAELRAVEKAERSE